MFKACGLVREENAADGKDMSERNTPNYVLELHPSIENDYGYLI
jgi:hypothetical protein